MSHKSVVRQGEAATEPLGLEGIGLRAGFMPEVRVWAKSRGNRHGVQKPLWCPRLPVHCSVRAKTGLVMPIETLAQGALMDRGSLQGTCLERSCPFV